MEFALVPPQVSRHCSAQDLHLSLLTHYCFFLMFVATSINSRVIPRCHKRLCPRPLYYLRPTRYTEGVVHLLKDTATLSGGGSEGEREPAEPSPHQGGLID